MIVGAILAAAGRGSRLGRRKQLLELDGRPLAGWALETLSRSPLVGSIVIACEDDERDQFQALALTYGNGKVCSVVAGGERRQDSVYAALMSLPRDVGLVLVHDGARPFVTQEIIERCVTAASRCGAAIAAIPVKDTIKTSQDGAIVAATIPREQLWAAQTPQAFARDVIEEAHERARRAGFFGTDDAMLVEWAGLATVSIVDGSYDNVKVTTEEDLAVAERIAARQKAAS